MLLFNDVSFSYSNENVLSGVNLELREGDFLFLIGKSGSGKSTLLQMIYMNILPQAGYVEFGKYTSDTIKPNQLPYLRRNVGVVFQDFKLLEDRNVYENLEFVMRVTGTPKSKIKRKIYQVLSDVGLTHKQRNYPNQLSGGEQQRIAIARAIVNDPILILADEPTGNLDPETSIEIMDILKKINSRGTAVICATHNYDLVKKYNARIMRLTDGRVVKVNVKSKSSVNS